MADNGTCYITRHLLLQVHLQAEVDRALLHFAQTPSEITVLMARYCETLGAKAA